MVGVVQTIFDSNKYVVSSNVCEIILTDPTGKEKARAIIDLVDKEKSGET